MQFRVRATQTVYRVGHPIAVELVLRNVGETGACVPREMAVGGSLQLRMTLNGKPIAYTGMQVRVAQPGAHSFVCLGPQEFIGQRIDLSLRSPTGFKIKDPGTYRLHARFTNRDVELLRERLKKKRPDMPIEAWEDPRCLPAQEQWAGYWRGELSHEVQLRVER